MSTPESKVESTISGSGIKGLFSTPTTTDIIVKNKQYGNLKFKVRPMTNEIYAKMGEAMKSKGIELDKTNLIDGLKVFAQVYYPAMKVVFPYCCLDPKIMEGVSTDSSTLDLNTVPMDILMELFNQLMAVSGLTDDKEKERKN